MPGLCRGQGGTSLIEVLVSLLILSIGLLGLAGLQTAALRSTQAAYQRTQATLLANDMAERMRSNPAGIAAGAYEAGSGARNAHCLSRSGCSVTEMAAHDLAVWQEALARALPSGAGELRVDPPVNDGTAALYVISIHWDANRDGRATEGHVVTVSP